jgi:phosphotriesterase-related protein
MVEYDTFGHERYPDSRGFMMPSDQERVAAVVAMLEAGHQAKLLLSQDVCFRHLWRHYGGWGYANISQRVRPMLRDAGVSDKIQEGLLIENPARLLAYVADA